ncbi:MAG: acyl-CoA thioester hydrolase/BAAT C-terminal domain-containing protein [Pseudomonadota bacterium]
MCFKSGFSTALLALWLSSTVAADRQPQIDLSEERSLRSEPVDITIKGLEPWTRVTVQLSTTFNDGYFDDGRYVSEAHFQSGADGSVEILKQAPLGGDYQGIDPFGLFWSLARAKQTAEADGNMETAETDADEADPAALTEPRQYELSILVDGEVLATRTLERVAVKSGVTTRRLNDGRLRGVLWLPPGDGPHPAFVVLSGSGGGYPNVAAQQLVNRGYAALSLAYFGAADLPENIIEIPLEYFIEGIDWLADQPEVDPDRLGVQGRSRGGELALLLASIEPRLKAVLAWVPSHVVWSGCCIEAAMSQSAWSLDGAPLSFAGTNQIAYDRFMYWHDMIVDNEIAIGEFFWLSMADETAVNAAAIEVERIQGAIMMISGGRDEMWPASYMADQVVARLNEHNFEYPHVHVTFDEAGHALHVFPDTPMDHRLLAAYPDSPLLYRMGGTPAAMAWTPHEAWRLIEQFFDEHL